MGRTMLVSIFLLFLGGIQGEDDCMSPEFDPVCAAGSVFNSTEIQSVKHLNIFEFGRLIKEDPSSWTRIAGGKVLVTMAENGTVLVFKQFSFVELQKDYEENRNKNSTHMCTQGICLERTEENEEFAEKYGKFQLFNNDIPRFAVLTSAYIIMGVTGIIGNILTIVGVMTARKLQNSTGVLICSLAAGDVIVLGFCLPFELFTEFFKNSFALSSFFCKAIQYVKYTSIVVSTNSMACMALDRFIAICRPLKAKVYCTVARARLSVLFIWVISSTLCIPVILYSKVIEISQDPPIKRCQLVWGQTWRWTLFNAAFLAVVFALPLLIMLPAYLKISFVLWKSTKAASKLQGSSKSKDTDDPKSESIQARLQVIKMLIAVLVAFVVCWGPVCLFEYLNAGATYSEKVVTKLILLSIGLGNSFLNPVIYFSMSKSFRGFMISALYKICCCFRATEPDTYIGRTTRISEISSSVKSSSEQKIPNDKPDVDPAV